MNLIVQELSLIHILDDCFRVDKDYWGSRGSSFWLRAPYYYNIYEAQFALPGYLVERYDVVSDKALVPAFELNLSNVSFLSLIHI